MGNENDNNWTKKIFMSHGVAVVVVVEVVVVVVSGTHTYSS